MRNGSLGRISFDFGIGDRDQLVGQKRFVLNDHPIQIVQILCGISDRKIDVEVAITL